MSAEENNERIYGTILIVDDNPKNLQVIGSLLNSQGYNIALANSGEKALNFLSKKNADLILLDIMMPEMDGFEVISRIKADNALNNIPVIFLTAKTDIKDIVAAFQSGGVDYVTKPFNKEEILSRIKTHIELKKSRDIILRQNEKLAASEQTLLELNKTKDKFFSIIAHDLRNPLNAFSNLTEMLNNDYDDFSEDERRELLKVMFNSAKSVNNLLENLLTWARAQTGRIKYEPGLCDVREIIINNTSLLQLHASKKNIAIQSKTIDGLYAYADNDMATTILRNLISNAIKFTRRDGKIEVSASKNDNFIEISVSDNGVGISEKIMPKLFRIEEHHNSIGTEDEKGTGLGLILCKEFVEINGGLIKVSSEENIGSTFTFTLPAWKNNEPT